MQISSFFLMQIFGSILTWVQGDTPPTPMCPYWADFFVKNDFLKTHVIEYFNKNKLSAEEYNEFNLGSLINQRYNKKRAGFTFTLDYNQFIKRINNLDNRPQKLNCDVLSPRVSSMIKIEVLDLCPLHHYFLQFNIHSYYLFVLSLIEEFKTEKIPNKQEKTNTKQFYSKIKSTYLKYYKQSENLLNILYELIESFYENYSKKMIPHYNKFNKFMEINYIPYYTFYFDYIYDHDGADYNKTNDKLTSEKTILDKFIDVIKPITKNKRKNNDWRRDKVSYPDDIPVEVQELIQNGNWKNDKNLNPNNINHEDDDEMWLGYCDVFRRLQK